MRYSKNKETAEDTITEKQRQILITGIRGFIGSNLKDYLQNNEEKFNIVGCSRDAGKIEHLKREIYSVCSLQEVLSSKNSTGYHSYIHLAGKVFNNSDKSKADEFDNANYVTTKRLFDRFCADGSAKKFIFLSTIHVLTENPVEILDEHYEPKPFTPYGKSKFKAEKYLLKNVPKDKQVYVLRPSMVHGPGNKGNLNSLFHLIKSGFPYPLGAINNQRSFVSIENLCFIITQILNHDIESGLYHIADDDPTFTHDLIKLIADETGRKARIWNINPSLLYMIAKMGSKLSLPLNEHRYNKLIGDFIVSNTKIKQAIDKPLPVTSSEGLRKTVASLNGK